MNARLLWLLVGAFVIGCGGEPAPFVTAQPTTHPDVNVSFGTDGGGFGSSSGNADSSGGDVGGEADAGGLLDSGTTSGGSSGGNEDGGSNVPDSAAVDSGNAEDSGFSPDAGNEDSGAGTDIQTPKSCGDNQCELVKGETCATCPADCGICCGNNKCDNEVGESCYTCPNDCGSCCGNGKCDAGLNETCTTCAKDCGPCGQCGDGKCDASLNETCTTCAQDCGACTKCGDGKCEGTENANTCPADCKISSCSLPCHPVTQQGCATNVQCYPNANSAICASYGTKKIGEGCEGINDCLKGLLCVNKLCKKLCSTKGAQGFTCNSGETCDSLVSGGKTLPCDLGACFGDDGCNLITSAKCPATHNCVPAGVGKKQCVPYGTKGQGATCTVDMDCQKDFLCLGSGAGKPKTCLKKCHSGGGNPKCAAGLGCATVTTGNPPQPAGDFLGVCTK